MTILLSAWLVTLSSLCFAHAARRGVSGLKPPLYERIDYKSNYACEGSDLLVSCEGKGLIRLARANYGRFSISVCNEQGILDMSVNCISYKSFLLMTDRCSMKPSCSVTVSSDMFGDPCPGTHKYLEVQYHCVQANESNRTLSNEVNSTFPKDDASRGGGQVTTTLSSTHPTSPSRPSTVSSTAAPPASTSLSTQQRQGGGVSSALIPPLSPTASPTTEHWNRPVSSSPGRQCPAVIARDLFWNWTQTGEQVVQNCPAGATGLARWQCSKEAMGWYPETPNLKDCRSLWLDNLRRRMDRGESVISVVTELALMTSSKLIFAEDLKELQTLIHHTLSKTVNTMETFLDLWHRYHVLRELLQSLLETLSNLLEWQQRGSWNDLGPDDRREVASSFIDHLEQSALLLADVSGKDDSFTFARSNILLSIQVVLNPREISMVHFPDMSDLPESTDWNRMEDSLVLPSHVLLDMAQHGLAKVVFIAYDQMGQFLAPERPSPSLSLQEVGGNDEPLFINVTKIINSRIISASVGRNGPMTRLPQPVIATLRHLHEENVTNPQCVFWDFNIGDWSTQGCWVQDTNRTHTVCACDHLTNFALLMDISPSEEVANFRDLIRLIISIGCGICIICLLLTLFCLFSIRALQGDHSTILKNLFSCLLVAEVVYVAGIDQTASRAACGLVAASLHYALLASFCWSLLEAFHHYVTLAEMFESEERPSRARWYYGLAYGTPACVLAIATLVDLGGSFGTPHYCWLRVDNYFIFSFIGPAVGVLFGAIIFLCIATCILFYHFNFTAALKTKEETKLALIKSWIRSGFILISGLVGTWTTGLLVLHRDSGSTGLAYAFCVLNALLGILIFILYCLSHHTVREKFERWLYHQGLLREGASLPTKTSEATNGSLPSATVEHSISPEAWNSLPLKDGVLAFTTQSPPYMAAGSSPSTDQLPSQQPREMSPHYLPSVAGSPVNVKLCVLEPSNAGAGTKWRVQEAWKRSYKPYGTTIGDTVYTSYNSFSDHIYETIEDDEYRLSASLVHHIPNDYGYGDHSDLSQHSSSSYGYDQRPLLIASLHPGRQPIYGIARNCTLTPEAYGHRRSHHKSHRRTASDKISNTDSFASSNAKSSPHPPCDGEAPTATESEEKERTTPGAILPDLLRCPADSSNVVMAVLDGQKVISCIQPDSEESSAALQYKLSTYC